MTIPLKSKLEIHRLARASLQLFQLFRDIQNELLSGVQEIYLDRWIRKYLRRHGLSSAMAGYKGYPAHCSINRNAMAVHGVPTAAFLKSEDIFTIDVAARIGGWVSDSAWTYLMPDISDTVAEMYIHSWHAFREIIASIRAGITLQELADAAQATAKEFGLYILPDFTGHGIGRELHEPPVLPFISSSLSAGSSIFLQEGMVLNIEPVFTSEVTQVENAEDGWGFYTRDNLKTVHFELTVALTMDGAYVLQFENCDVSALPQEIPFGIITK